MTVKELKEKLKEVDENLVVIVETMGKEIESVRYDKSEIKVGDKVRTVKDIDSHGIKLFPIGTIGQVTEIDDNDYIKPYKVTADYNDYWYYSRDMLEKVVENYVEVDRDELADHIEYNATELYICGDGK